MRCMRILPELWASTSWPLSVFTRKVAFLRDSTTVPSSRMACSFAFVFDSVFFLLLWHVARGPRAAAGQAYAIKAKPWVLGAHVLGAHVLGAQVLGAQVLPIQVIPSVPVSARA